MKRTGCSTGYINSITKKYGDNWDYSDAINKRMMKRMKSDLLTGHIVANVQFLEFIKSKSGEIFAKCLANAGTNGIIMIKAFDLLSEWRGFYGIEEEGFVRKQKEK